MEKGGAAAGVAVVAQQFFFICILFRRDIYYSDATKKGEARGSTVFCPRRNNADV